MTDHRQPNRLTLILASASPARLATLSGAGIDPTVVVSDVDEAAVLAALLAVRPAAPPAEQVLALARAKARDVARREPSAKRANGIVLGCDSMLELDGETLGKPRDAGEAERRIAQQSGRSALLHTGHWLVDLRDGRPEGRIEVGATSSTVVRFATLTREEIGAYVATGEPLAVAGAFTIDGLGGPFIEGIDGDHHGVVGLSLPTLRHLLAQLDVSVMALWRPGTETSQAERGDARHG